MKARMVFLAGVSLAACETAWAQDQGEVSQQGLDEIIVTARRTEERLLDVPLAITALDGRNLEDTGLKAISELQYQTPGLIANNGAGFNQLYIRGVGNNIYVGADPSVATYIDDVPRIYGTMVNNLFNVDRVEVIKGAPGGLYGRNATGGVVNIATRRPNPDRIEASGLLSYGEEKTFRAAGYLNMPLGGGAALNLSIQRDSHDPYLKNLNSNPAPYTAAMFPVNGSPGTLGGVNVNPYGTPAQTASFFNSFLNPPEGLHDQDVWSGAINLYFEPFADFSITLSSDYARKRDSEGNGWYVQGQSFLQGAYENILFPFFAGIYQTCGESICPATSFPAGFFAADAPKFKIYAAVPAYNNLTDYGGSATAVLGLGGVDVTSITALRRQRVSLYQDNGPTVTATLVPITRFQKNFFYQELRFVSTGEGPLSFLGGGTYLKNDVDGDARTVFFNVVDPAFPQFGSTSSTLSNSKVENWSIYGQMAYDLTDTLTLTVSGRYIHEKNRTSFSAPAVSQSTSSVGKFLPSATISYGLANGDNVYARYAKGFKAGGVNTFQAPSAFPTPTGSVFGPEEVDTFEVGYKASLADQTLQLTAAAFYNDYRGLQTNATGNAENPGILLAIINAGTARTYGIEGALSWRAASPLTLGLNAGYLDAKYKSFKNDDGSTLSVFDFSGTRMIFSPKWQISSTADLDLPLNDRLNLTGNVLISYTSRIRMGYSTTPGLPDPVQKAYTLTNARLGVGTSDGRYEVAMFAHNLFNTAYATYGISGFFGNPFTWGNPRIVGAELRITY